MHGYWAVACTSPTPQRWCVSNGDLLTTDGPFVESKEHLGGFYIIEAEDLDSAVSWASKVTQIVGAPIEVRPLRGLNYYLFHATRADLLWWLGRQSEAAAAYERAAAMAPATAEGEFFRLGGRGSR